MSYVKATTNFLLTFLIESKMGLILFWAITSTRKNSIQMLPIKPMSKTIRRKVTPNASRQLSWRPRSTDLNPVLSFVRVVLQMCIRDRQQEQTKSEAGGQCENGYSAGLWSSQFLQNFKFHSCFHNIRFSTLKPICTFAPCLIYFNSILFFSNEFCFSLGIWVSHNSNGE